jgi:uncharacterized protein YdaU (DUF1376 family)
VNYWARWISAIRKRTADLSLIEMGAYDRLLDHYYAEEGPLPAELERCYRLAGAVTKAEQEAVRHVLGKFFVLAEDGYHNERADEELALGLKKIGAAQSNGKLGGRPRGSGKNPTPAPAPKPTTKPGGFSDGTGGGAQDETSPSPSVVGEANASPPTAPGDTHSADGEFIGAPQQQTGASYGEIAGAIRRAGVADVSSGHPDFRAAVDAGATADEFLAKVPDALAKAEKPFLYLVASVVGARTRAAKLKTEMHHGPMPAPTPPSAASFRERDQAAAAALVAQWAPQVAARPVAASPIATLEVIDVTASRLD